MNKAFLLTFCLLFASFTGCVDNSEDNDDLTSEIERLTEENKDLNEELANQTKDNDALASDTAKLTEQLTNQTEENGVLNSEIVKLNEQNSNLSHQLDLEAQLVAEHLSVLQFEFTNLTEQIQNLNEQLQNSTEDNIELIFEIANLSAQIQSLNIQIEEMSVLLPFQPQSREELKIAVDRWIASPQNGNYLYGYITDWDTSSVTNMSGLFSDTSFNGNISDWNVSSVTDMTHYVPWRI